MSLGYLPEHAENAQLALELAIGLNASRSSK